MVRPGAGEVLLVGAGHAHLEVLHRLARRGPRPGARFTLVTRQRQAIYSGMLPGVIAGLYPPEAAQIDVAGLAAAARVGLHYDELQALDLAARRACCRSGASFGYDLISLNIGAAPAGAAVPGVIRHATPVKPIDGFLARFEALRRSVVAAGGGRRIGVVGGGASGVELILAIERRLHRDLAAAGPAGRGPRLTLLTASEEILPAFPARLRRRFAALLRARGIEVVAGVRVDEVHEDAVVVWRGEQGRARIGLDAVLWATQAAPAAWLAETGLALDADGFIDVAATLQSVSHPELLAAGDIAGGRAHARPKSGVHAVRDGALLAGNLERLLAGRTPLARRPQQSALALISTGERYAVGARGPLVIAGGWVWTLKDGIDRRYVARLRRAGRAASL